MAKRSLKTTITADRDAPAVAPFDIARARAQDWRAAVVRYESVEGSLNLCEESPDLHSATAVAIDKLEDALGSLDTEVLNVAERILLAPASSETTELKIDLFRHFWSETHRDLVLGEFREYDGSYAWAAVAICLDILSSRANIAAAAA